MATIRTVIPPELRPRVKGTDVAASEPFESDVEQEHDCHLVLCAPQDDRTAGRLREVASELGFRVWWVNPQSRANLVEFVHALERFGRGRSRPGVLARLPGTADARLADELAMVEDTLSAYAGPVANRLGALCSNISKLWHVQQLAGVREGSVRLPETSATWRVSANASVLEAGRVVKSISGTRSQAVEEGDARLAIEAEGAPFMRQARVAGSNVRAHVVGEAVVAVRISTSGAIDYRYAGDLVGTRCELPPSVQSWCRAAARREGLLLAGVDLIESGGGKWFALEVNPSPAYEVFEDLLDSPAVSELLAVALATEAGPVKSQVPAR